LAPWYRTCIQQWSLLTANEEVKMAGSKGKDWRELCAAASEEPDAEKLFYLVNQILRAFDERDQQSMLRRCALPPSFKS
ncbi:MAG: hypothetical protein ACXVJL_09045, partial [Candidatus Angelobacter sp.]